MVFWNSLVVVGILEANAFLISSALLQRQPGNGHGANDDKLMVDFPSFTKDRDATWQCTLRSNPFAPWAPHIDTNDPPDWWVPECRANLRGVKIAIAFRGDYHRFSRDGFSHCPGPACSDYWVSKKNIEETISKPLRLAGALLRMYFHTFNDKSCPHRDGNLIRDIRPAKYKFDAEYHEVGYKGLAYTYIEAMKLVIEDNWADHVVLIRFDVQYVAPITNWNMQWGSFNFMSDTFHGKIDDLVYVIPANLFTTWLEGLNTTSRSEQAAELMPNRNPMPDGFAGIVRNCSEHSLEC